MVSDVDAVGKNFDYIRAVQQIFFNIPIIRYGHFFASIFDDTFDGILKVPIFEWESV